MMHIPDVENKTELTILKECCQFLFHLSWLSVKKSTPRGVPQKGVRFPN